MKSYATAQTTHNYHCHSMAINKLKKIKTTSTVPFVFRSVPFRSTPLFYVRCINLVIFYLLHMINKCTNSERQRTTKTIFHFVVMILMTTIAIIQFGNENPFERKHTRFISFRVKFNWTWLTFLTFHFNYLWSMFI